MKKLSVILCVILMIATVLSGCGVNTPPAQTSSSSPSATAAPASSPASEGPKTITLWHSFTQENRAAVIKEMTDKYTAAHPNVKFEIEIYPWATFDTKWKTGLSANALPDVSTALPETISMLTKADVLTPLNDMIEEMGNPFIQKPLDTHKVNGNYMAAPFYAHARVLWYRKDILQKNNITPPATLDELLDAATKVTKTGEMYGMAVPMGKKEFYGTVYLYITSKSMGGNLIKQDGRANLTSPEMIKAIQYLVDMYKNASPEGSISYGDPETNDSFIQGKAAFYYESGFAINRVLSGNPDIADKFGCLAPPTLEKGGVPGWLAAYINFVVWKGEDEKTCKDFVKTLYNTEDYVKFLHLVPGGMLPTLKGVAESKEYLSHETISKFKDDIAVIAQGVANGTPIGADFGLVPAMNVVQSQGIIEEMLQSIVLGGISVEDAAKDAEAKLNAAIDSIGK